MELLFSYGTLQMEQVQIDTFGRTLKGLPDVLSGYRIEKLEITDEEVLASSKERYHPIAVPTGNAADLIEGVVFEVSEEEIIQADIYEAEEYVRVKETMKSGRSAWVYVSTIH